MSEFNEKFTQRQAYLAGESAMKKKDCHELLFNRRFAVRLSADKTALLPNGRAELINPEDDVSAVVRNKPTSEEGDIFTRIESEIREGTLTRVDAHTDLVDDSFVVLPHVARNAMFFHVRTEASGDIVVYLEGTPAGGVRVTAGGTIHLISKDTTVELFTAIYGPDLYEDGHVFALEGGYLLIDPISGVLTTVPHSTIPVDGDVGIMIGEGTYTAIPNEEGPAAFTLKPEGALADLF